LISGSSLGWKNNTPVKNVFANLKIIFKTTFYDVLLLISQYFCKSESLLSFSNCDFKALKETDSFFFFGELDFYYDSVINYEGESSLIIFN